MPRRAASNSGDFLWCRRGPAPVRRARRSPSLAPNTPPVLFISAVLSSHRNFCPAVDGFVHLLGLSPDAGEPLRPGAAASRHPQGFGVGRVLEARRSARPRARTGLTRRISRRRRGRVRVRRDFRRLFRGGLRACGLAVSGAAGLGVNDGAAAATAVASSGLSFSTSALLTPRNARRGFGRPPAPRTPPGTTAARPAGSTPAPPAVRALEGRRRQVQLLPGIRRILELLLRLKELPVAPARCWRRSTSSTRNLAPPAGFSPAKASALLPADDRDPVHVVVHPCDRLRLRRAGRLPSRASVKPLGRNTAPPVDALALGKSQRNSSEVAYSGARNTMPPVITSGRNAAPRQLGRPGSGA